MFEPTDKPRIFGIPPGADFPAQLVAQILGRYANKPPHELARVRILVHTRRMQRRIREQFAKGPARLLPQIGLATEIDTLLPGADLPPSVSTLRRRLEMAELVKALIARDPSLAPRAAAVDLADSLSALLDEMESEGVAPDRLTAVEIGDDSTHWRRSLAFLSVANDYLVSISDHGIDTEARRRAAIEMLCSTWSNKPPETPVIIAGSTGSRSGTALLMRCVARLPQGALVLPGFDFDLPPKVWSALCGDQASEDHPQYRLAALLKSLDIHRDDVTQWGKAPDEARNRLISLSLRPAHVTDQWLTEGPSLDDLRIATKGITLIEAPQPIEESLAIAVALREAVQQDKQAALITPDRALTRRVAAALARWGIIPDDSAGVPLSLTPPGRLLRQIIRLAGEPATPDAFLALLKHPLTRSGDDKRGRHMLNAHALEVFCRENGVVAVTSAVMAEFAETFPDLEEWALGIDRLLARLSVLPPPRLGATVAHHLDLAEAISAGTDGSVGKLWDGATGRAVRAELERFLDESDFSGNVTLADYIRLLDKSFSADSDRVLDNVHSNVMIWGTLEARAQGAQVVVLGGLNDGVWPEQPNPDPWLNRRMRQQLGLLLPDREIGLSAHDYQQAVAAERVILSRAARNEESETVPSRWLNRLTNLLAGLPSQGGDDALKTMRERGDRLLSLATALDRPDEAFHGDAVRPAPSPPVRLRPKRFSVTEITTLIRDPYAIYAKRILGLKPLSPIIPQPDARMKGTVFHEILESFFAADADFVDPDAERARLKQITATVLEAYVPWSSIRAHWAGHLASIADWLITTEIDRRSVSTPVAREVSGGFIVPGTTQTIRGKADRIDRLHEGGLVIYDYKSGRPSTPEQVRVYDRQLLIEAVMAEHGAFTDIDADHVAYVAHIGVGRSPVLSRIDLVDDGAIDYSTVTVLSELAKLLTAYNDVGTGYISRRAMETLRYDGDYDHLARFGEWDESATTIPEVY